MRTRLFQKPYYPGNSKRLYCRLIPKDTSATLFVSPAQSTPIQGSPRLHGFHSLDYQSQRVGNKAECPKEQTHQLGSQLSSTPYYADILNRHENVIIGKTKQTQEASSNGSLHTRGRRSSRIQDGEGPGCHEARREIRFRNIYHIY